MALFSFKPASSNAGKPFMTAEWSMQTDPNGVYVVERLAGIGARRSGPMSAGEADRLVAARRAFVADLQRAIASE